MTRITAKSLIKTLEEFFSSKKGAIINEYDSRKARTLKIIGPSRSSSVGSPLGDFISNNFTGYGYRREDGSIDLSIHRQRKPYRNILNMWFDHRSAPLTLHQPVYYDILIELENRVEIAHEEMTKLTYYNSGLKILILVLWTANDLSDSYEEAHRRLAENFRLIIKTTNSIWQENESNVYVLVTLQLIGTQLYCKSTLLPVKKIMDDKFAYAQRTAVF